MPVMTVAPVVVRPDMDSNKASVNVMFVSADKIKGNEPTSASVVQKSVTMIKPSLSLMSVLDLETGSHKNKPVSNVIA